MKFRHLILGSVMVALTFTGCKQDKKKDNLDTEDKMEMEDSTMQKDRMDKKSADKAADANEMNLQQAAMNSEELTTLVSAINSAGMAVKLKSDGPFTIFAPTNDAFNDLPNGTVEELMEPKNKEKLEAVLSYHIVPGNLDAAKLRDLIAKNDGDYTLKTANDGDLNATINNAGNIVLTDGRGKKSTVVSPDIKASNGYIHSVNSVLMRD